MNKVCFTCRITKPLTEFYKATKEKSGYQSNCKQCYKDRYAHTEQLKAYLKKHYQDNKEKYKEYSKRPEVRERSNARKRERYSSDPEYKTRVRAHQIKEYSKQSTREKARARTREWALKNPDRVRENRIRWTNENRESIKEQKRGYWKRAPKSVTDKRKAYLKEYRKTDSRKAVVKNYSHKRRSQIQETDITSRWLKNFLAKSLNCEICNCELDNKGNVYPNGKQLDHILPIAVGGEHKKNNVRVVCLKCNVSRPKDGSDILKLVI